jgi:hypothetical protein
MACELIRDIDDLNNSLNWDPEEYGRILRIMGYVFFEYYRGCLQRRNQSKR